MRVFTKVNPERFPFSPSSEKIEKYNSPKERIKRVTKPVAYARGNTPMHHRRKACEKVPPI
jgi:hypothetical protein